MTLSNVLVHLGTTRTNIGESLIRAFNALGSYQSSGRPLELGVCAVRSAWFFFKFVTESIRIGFVIIKTDAYQLGSVF